MLVSKCPVGICVNSLLDLTEVPPKKSINPGDVKATAAHSHTHKHTQSKPWQVCRLIQYDLVAVSIIHAVLEVEILQHPTKIAVVTFPYQSKSNILQTLFRHEPTMSDFHHIKVHV